MLKKEERGLYASLFQYGLYMDCTIYVKENIFSMKRLLLALFFMFFSITLHSQVVEFNAFRISKGTTNSRMSIYVWECWHSGTQTITFNLTNNMIKVGDETFEIVERPTKWVIKRDCKYCVFGCVDNFFNKVCVKLYDYDNSNIFCIYVNKESSAVKYATLKLGD